MNKGPTQEIINRVEAIEGREIVDAAKARYLAEERSFGWLALHWGINQRTVRRILIHYGITIRHGSDAIVSQWRDNSLRRKQAATTLAATKPEAHKPLLQLRPEDLRMKLQ